MQLTGAEIICECLLEQGVDTVFGYPGGAALNTYDALYKYSDRIRHILTAHEQGASHAADGYARATGKTGVVMTTSGPGATNIVTGLATANIDSIPLVAITGNVTTDQLGRDSFQEVDIVDIVKPVTKASFLVEKVEDLADTIRKAFALAQHGRKGPVLVDVPKDVTANKTEFVQTIPERPRTFEIRNPEKVRVVQEMIKNAKRPMIYAGGGIISADASEEFKAFAELIDAPVCCSLMGLGCIPADHPLCVGNIGMHGGYETGMATAECDLMIACGARFSDRVAGDRERFGEQLIKENFNYKTPFVFFIIIYVLLYKTFCSYYIKRKKGMEIIRSKPLIFNSQKISSFISWMIYPILVVLLYFIITHRHWLKIIQ